MAAYNKLVRDYIPDIIEKAGKKYQIRQLSEEEYIDALREKLREETNELMNAWSRQEVIEEAADLLEVLHALATANETSMDAIEEMRQKKAEERGAFQQRVFLLEVDEEPDAKL